MIGGVARLRPARIEDARELAPLVRLAAPELIDIWSGGSHRGIRLLERSVRTAGAGASWETFVVAERDGMLAGALSAFPAGQIPERGSRFVRLSLRALPPWRWPRMLRVNRLLTHVAPAPPEDALYVDTLAVGPAHQRQGIGSALLRDAERRARELGLPRIALDAEVDNAPARALYEGHGFVVSEQRRGRGGLPGFVGYVKRL